MAIRVAPDLTKQIGRLRFTEKDYVSIRDEMIGRIDVVCVDSQGNPKWTDFNSSDIGITLLELVAGVGTTILWHLDNAANEAFLINAIQRKNVMAHVKTVGYRMSHVQSSLATVTLTLPSAHTEDIRVPKFTVVRTAGNPVVSFAVLEDYVWPAGDLSIDVSVAQGVYTTETFAGTGAGNQILQLSDLRVGQNTVDVEVNGITWTEVTSFVASDSADEDFLTETDDRDYTYVRFGDGYFGLAPPAASVIRIRYLKSDGEDGNVGAGKIVALTSVLYDVLNAPVVGIVVSNQSTAPAVTGTVTEPFVDIVGGTNSKFRYKVVVAGVPGVPTEFDLGDAVAPLAADIAADIISKQSALVAVDDGTGKVRLSLTGGGLGPQEKIHILEVSNSCYAALGFTKGLTVGRSGSATGGAEEETIKTAKRQAPPYLQALDRAVTKWDYQAFMNAWPGVAKAQCWGEQEENPPNYDLFNKIKITFVPEGGGVPSLALRDQVTEMLELKKVVTTKILYVDPVFVDVNIDVTAYLNANYDPTTVKAEITDTLNDLLDENEIEFLEDVRYANVVRLVDEILGVHHCHVRVNGGVDDVKVELGEIARKGTFSIVMVLRSSWVD